VVRFLIFPFICSLSLTVFSQNSAKKRVLESLQNHVEYLSSDSLEGRRAGSKGELLASAYISQYFSKLKVKPYIGSHNYLQSFDLFDGYEPDSSTSLIINGFKYKIEQDFFPLSFSAHRASLKDEIYPMLKEAKHIWVNDISELIERSKSNPHVDFNNELRNLSIEASSKGALAVILYNSSQDHSYDVHPKKYFDSIAIPVIYLAKNEQIRRSHDENVPFSIQLNLNLIKKSRNIRNVTGYIDNKSKETIVLGAHYDHLGFGEDGNSMLRNDIKQIHNGADDNASGTALLLELAAQLSHKKYAKYNYIIIAFSAEELGLIGSKYFVENHDFELTPVKFMINMDMVGRLNDSTKTLTLGGIGTSPTWSNILNQKSSSVLKFKFDSSGAGPSDHTSFYRKNIPVLFYFTGLHTDYHKPSDDSNKINFNGIFNIYEHVLHLIRTSYTLTIPFTKTREQQISSSTRFSVSLGIMPDYSFTGNGVRIDGLSEGKLASEVGLLANDVLTQLGLYSIESVESYMKALSKFKKGETVQLSYKRGEELRTIQITFK
jgi:aminopeptidase YwaD